MIPEEFWDQTSNVQIIYGYVRGKIPRFNTYLKRKMKIWEVRVIGSLEHVSLEVHVGDLVNLENLLFIHLFQGKEPVMQIDEGHLSVRATAKIFYQLKVFH